MIALETFRTPAFVKLCEDALYQYSQDTPGVQNVLLTTVDGFKVAANGQLDEQSADKLSAVGSSLFALGSSLVSEFGLDACNAVTIDSGQGKVYIREVSPMSDRILILIIKTTKNAMLAHILHGTAKLANHLGEQMLSLK